MSEDVEHPKSEREGRRQRIPKVFFKPKPVKVGDELEVTVSEVSRRGDGLIRVEGYVIFIPNTKQGDTVKIRITQIRPNYAVAQVI